MYAFTFVAEVLVKIADSSLTRKFFLLEIYNKTNELRYALLYFIETNSNWLVLDLVSLDAFRRGYNTSQSYFIYLACGQYTVLIMPHTYINDGRSSARREE